MSTGKGNIPAPPDISPVQVTADLPKVRSARTARTWMSPCTAGPSQVLGKQAAVDYIVIGESEVIRVPVPSVLPRRPA
ncbi:hypothetical protein [Streptomyces sp. NBC_01618]|uniref:hypothetical protein n=1 Tax=Streptomyces sp. NBC_01618 TaxID=2975900 RepID=UPI00386CF210|nr:hypothetical protein OH735_36160 [Streptomyces sp. NBC_01618]